MRMHTRRNSRWSGPLGVALAGLACAADAATLWQIGQPDNSTAEFALAPGSYKSYRAPGFFVVGQSDAKVDWPYVQPGVIDGGWAPGSPQTFEILFGLASAPTAGESSLVLDLADAHGIDPPRLRVEVNGHVSEHATSKGAGDASVFGNPTAGREQVITISVPAAWLRAGENRVAITTVAGSWILWDAVRFDAPHIVPLVL